MIAEKYILEGRSKEFVLKQCELSRSSYYYYTRSTHQGRGRPKSTVTYNHIGEFVSNEQVVEDIKTTLGIEFVDYGYFKMTCELQQSYSYKINHKKVYRLMTENQLLNKPKRYNRSKREWVKKLVPEPECDFSYLEIDIKYIYIQGQKRSALLLSVIDVSSRWILGHFLQWSISKNDVVKLFELIFKRYQLPDKLFVRNDNGSQFEASVVRAYLIDKKVQQEFTKPATPEQNAHIESYHSIIESVICNQYEFDTINEAKETFIRFVNFYNYKRIHSGIGYISPYKYLVQKGTDLKVNLPPYEPILNSHFKNKINLSNQLTLS